MTCRLVAIDRPAGPGFVDTLHAVWDDGDAALPLDQRLPAAARRALLEALRPATVIDAGGDTTRLPGGRPVEQGDALVVATSGTTGTPKGVVLTQGALQAHAAAVHDRLGVTPGTDRWLACLPLAHVGGLGVVVRALVDGIDLTVLEGFDAEAVTAEARRGATLVSLVPTALDRLDPALFRWVVLGGSGDRRERPANVVHTYGTTETGGGIVYDGVPLNGVEMRLATVEGPGDVGAIKLRSPTLLRAYRDGRVPVDDDGWYGTGDLGRLDSRGRLEVLGRADDLIVTGGENVWPTPVEHALVGLPGIAAAAVTGRPDPEWGQRVVATVELAPGQPQPSLREVRAALASQLPAFAAPRELVVVDELPRTALGKVRRDRLA